MSRLNMIVADDDRHYVEGLVRFLSGHHSARIRLNYFTESAYLKHYLENSGQRTDILLISPSFLNGPYDFRGTGMVVVLSEGGPGADCADYSTVNKYQAGDKLVGSILNLYAEKFPEKMHMTGSGKPAKALAVFSPIGGAGKSTVAVALASALAAKGKKTFYLNLENIQTTPVFFECAGEQTLSDILYFIKDRSKALSLKIEAVKQVDEATGVHYFCPPESIADMEEIEPEELGSLIAQIKNMNKYDAVIVDLSNQLDHRNIFIMDACDEILLLMNPGPASERRMQGLAKELELLQSGMQVNILGKCTAVLNKDNAPNSPEYRDIRFGSRPVAHRIPKTSALICSRGNVSAVNRRGGFGQAIETLAESIL